MAGLRVLSFGTAIAGNVTAMALCELGADVVKIESPRRPDPLRVRIYPDQDVVIEPSGAETNIMFAAYSRSVRDITLDMKAADDQETFAQLLARADVLIDNYAGDVMERWGFGRARIREVNPRLVHLSVSGYGRTGPRSAYLAYGSTVNAYVGMSRAWVPHGTQLDWAVVAVGLPAVLAGLHHRDRTGQGVEIDVAQFEAGVALAAPLYLDTLNGGAGVMPEPNSAPGSVFSGVFPCLGLDRWLALELSDVSDWNALCAVLGSPDLGIVEEAEADVSALRERLLGWLAERTPHQAMLVLQRVGLAAGAVHDAEDMYRDPQHRWNHFFVDVDHPDLGEIEYPAPIHRLSRSDVRIRRPAPRLGEHNDEVRNEWLRHSEPR